MGVLLALLLFRVLYKLSRKEFLLLFDIILVIVPLGIMLGRLGNYLNQELYGISVQINGFPQFIRPDFIINFLHKLGFLHIYSNVDGNLRVNTNFLSMLFEGLALFIGTSLLFFKMLKKQKFSVGKISCFFIIGYSIVRFLLEYLRNDAQSEFIGRFTKSQRFFLLFFLCGILFLFLLQRKKAEPLS
jgi:phosphatidylglycerol:prolipoprotein diacylglycerol transferase